MSAEAFKGRSKSSQMRLSGEVLASGVAAGLAGVAVSITWGHHREKTHRSVELHPVVKKTVDAEQRSLGVGEASVWASVHRIHHQMTDASLYPFYQISRAVNWVEENNKTDEVKIPGTYKHLDPFVEEFSRDEVMEIGGHAEKFMEDRLGARYEKKKDYSENELKTILNPDKSTYYYPKYKRHTGEWSQEEIAHVLLTDPHSPALIDRENGVHGVAMQNVNLYKHAANLFRDEPTLRPDDLQGDESANKASKKRDVAAGFVLPSAAVLFKRGKYKPKDFAIALAAGSAINGFRTATELVGGNITNSMGHAGVLDLSKMTQAAFRKNYEFVLNDDGSLSADTVHAGIVGRMLSVATFDEVGGQQVHHKYPEKIAYTTEKGKKAWSEAPWGKFTEFLAKSKFPLIKEGKGFELKDGERRPDVPHEAIDLIQSARIRQINAKA